MFKDELNAGEGDITVWINSPGGDCVAAAQIYNMLIDYKGNVTVKIDGIAASAASVIAMAGTRVMMSPVSMLMIHNPMTMAFGNTAEMQKAIDMLGEVKESIINAYELKTSLSRILQRDVAAENIISAPSAMAYSRAEVTNSLMEKLSARCRIEPKPTNTERSVADLMERLNLIKN